MAGGRRRKKARQHAMQSQIIPEPRPYLVNFLDDEPGIQPALRASTATTLLKLLLSLDEDFPRATPATNTTTTTTIPFLQHAFLLDPTAGAGSLPILAHRLRPFLPTSPAPFAFSLAGDSSPSCATAAAQNAIHAGAAVDSLRMDCTALPLRGGALDAVVADLPFGMRCRVKGQAGFLERTVKEVVRVLAVGGKAVVMAVLVAQVEEALEKVGGVVRVRERANITMGCLEDVGVWAFEKVEATE